MASGFGRSFQMASDMLYDYTCTTCEEDNKNSEGLYFCKQCSKQFCEPCLKMHDKLLKGHTVLGKKDVNKWSVVRKMVAKEMCEEHDGNEIQMYCGDHDRVCCVVCISVSHRPCKLVMHVPDVAKDIQTNSKYKAIPTTVNRMKTKLSNKTDSKKKNRHALEQSSKSIVASIKQLRTSLNKMMDKVEKRTLDELDRMSAVFYQSIKSDIDACISIGDKLGKLLNNLQDKGKDDEPYAYVGFKKLEYQLTDAENLLQNMSDRDYEIKFNVDSKIEQFISSLNMFGQFECSPDTATGKVPSYDTDHIFTAASIDKYNVTFGDVRGICQVPNGRFIISNSLKKIIQLLDENFSAIDRLDMPPHPQDLCPIAGNEVAVAVTDWDSVHGIHFIQAVNGKLRRSRKIELKHECDGIVHHNRQLYVRSMEGLYIYTLGGQLVKKVFHEPSYDQTSRSAVGEDGRIYVTTAAANLLTTLDRNGRQLATLTHPDLVVPSCVCVTSNGHVFVCGYGSNTVLQVDKKGGKKLTTLAGKSDGLHCPTSLWFDRKTSRLIVGQAGNKIVVLTLK